jgi:AsmA family protein
MPMDANRASSSPRRRSALKWTLGLIGGILLVLVVALALLDWNALRKPIARYASKHLHRPVAINGDLRVHLFSWTPRVEVNGLTVGNPDWDQPGELAAIDRLAFQVKLLPLFVGHLNFDSIRIEHAQVRLHRNASGQANWVFTPNGQPDTSTAAAAPLKLPEIHALSIDGSHIELRDGQRHLSLSSSVSASDAARSERHDALQVGGKGELNAKPFSFQVRGDSLLSARAERPYDFAVEAKAGEISASVKGHAGQAFDLGTASAAIHVSGEDLANLYYLTGLALPNTPAFDLSADVSRNGAKIDVQNIAGRMGASDLSGELSVDLSGSKPKMTGSMSSRELNLVDLAAPLGAHQPARETIAAHDAATAKQTVGTTPAPENGLLPDAQLQVNRLRGMDADVHYSAASIKTEKIPLQKFAVHVILDDGVLKLSPVVFDFPQGVIKASAAINARTDIPKTSIDVSITDVKLEQFSKPGTTPALTGSMQARATLAGHGKSVHEVAGNANGSVTVVVPHGEVRQAFAELTGINVDRGVGLIIFNEHQTSTVRCGVANFEVTDGDMKAKNIVIDTDSVLITGSGDIKLKSEQLNLAIKGQPKKLRILRLRSPILITGDLKKPKVGVDVPKSVLQAGVATAIGTLLTPLAAVLAFVDPGLAKNADCAALLAPAEHKVEAPKTTAAAGAASH